MPAQEEEVVAFSEYPTSWKINLKPMAGNIVISELHASAYIVLSKAEKKTCLIRKYLVPQNVKRYIRGVALTEVVIAELNSVCVFVCVCVWRIYICVCVCVYIYIYIYIYISAR